MIDLGLFSLCIKCKLHQNHSMTSCPCSVQSIISLLGQQVSLAKLFLVFESFLIVSDKHLILVSPSPSVWFNMNSVYLFLI